MENITDINQLELTLRNNAVAMIYFSSEKCSVCKALKPKTELLFSDNFPLIKLFEVDIETSAAVAAHLGIFNAPSLLVFFEGKEFIRKTRVISLTELEKETERAYSIFAQ